MSHSHDQKPIPRPLLIGAGALVISAVLVTGFAQISGFGVQRQYEAQIVDSTMVLFKDEAGGAIGVYDYESGDLVWTFPSETGGFVRTAMRAVVHTRKLENIGPEEPFQIARTERGRLLLKDLATGRTVGLEAFGDANAREFEQLLTAKDV